MLDAMRQSVTNIFTKLLLGLLIVAFAIWGIGDYVLRRPAQDSTLATVGKTRISVDDFKQAYRDEMYAVARRLGRTLTTDQAQILGIPPRALTRLIGTTAIDLHTKALGITVTDDVLRNAIRGDPSFAGPDGKFSKPQFLNAIRLRGYRSEEDYLEASRHDLLREQVTETLSSAVTPQRFLVDAEHRYRDEMRVIEYIAPDLTKLVTVQEPAQDKLKSLFQQSHYKYKAPEERKINLLLVSRDAAMARVKIGDNEVRSAYDANKASYDVPEKRRILQLTFPDKAAAEKAYAELSKAKDFDKAAATLGFKASDMQLGSGPLTKAEMIDSKIADAAFSLQKDVLSRPVEGNYSVVLLRVPEIVAGKQRSFDDVKGGIRERIANERVSEELQSLYGKIEDERAKGMPLKEIAQELKLSLREVAGLTHDGKTADGKSAIAHAGAPRIAQAVFAATPGVETEVVELDDGGFAWFDLLEVTPERQKKFEEVAGEVKASFMEEERRKEIASLVAKQIEALKPGEGLDRLAKAWKAKVGRTAPLKRSATPPAGLTANVVQQAFGLPKGGVSSVLAPDGKSRIVFRVADVIAAPPATADETAAIKSELIKQMRVDLLDQYVTGLRTRYGYTVNEKRVMEALGESGAETGS